MYSLHLSLSLLSLSIEEITAALSSVFSPEGTSKKMSIDERVALMKERRASEQTAKEDELTAVLARRTSKTGGAYTCTCMYEQQ